MRDVVKECNEIIGQQQKLIATLEATVTVMQHSEQLATQQIKSLRKTIEHMDRGEAADAKLIAATAEREENLKADILGLNDRLYNANSVINRQQSTLDSQRVWLDDTRDALQVAYDMETELREYIDTLLDHNKILADTTVKTAKQLEEVGLLMIAVSDLVKTTAALGKKVLELCE
mgnify:CR=1 FL=1